MKKDLPEVEIIFCASSKNESEKCYEILSNNPTIKHNLKILPRYWIPGKGEKQTDVRDDILLIIYCDSREEFERISSDLKYFTKIKANYNCKTML